jgi:hypothetical protein
MAVTTIPRIDAKNINVKNRLETCSISRKKYLVFGLTTIWRFKFRPLAYILLYANLKIAKEFNFNWLNRKNQDLLRYGW